VIISPDDYLFDLNGKYRWTPDRVKAAWEHAYSGLHDAVRWTEPRKVVVVCGIPASGKSTWIRKNRESNTVYFDACLDLPWKREKILRLIRNAAWDHYKATNQDGRAGVGPRFELVWCNPTPTRAHQWNASRSKDRRVPREIIDKMASYFSANRPNGKREGFDAMKTVYRD